jgi:hypothetical protein
MERKAFFFKLRKKIIIFDHKKMQPVKAISTTIAGTFLLVILFSFFTNTGERAAPHSVCAVIKEATRLCKLPLQDRAKSAALDHVAQGYGMAKAIRESFSDDIIQKRCNVSMYNVDSMCQDVRTKVINALQQQSTTGGVKIA